MKLPRHYSGLRTSTRFLLTTFLITWPAWWLNAVLEPELERRISFFAACLATGAIWGLWHLPLWFTQGAGRETTPFLAFIALAVLH